MSERCWNTSEEIQNFMIQNRWDVGDKSSFLKLWNYFQKKAQDKAYKVGISSPSNNMIPNYIKPLKLVAPSLSRDIRFSRQCKIYFDVL